MFIIIAEDEPNIALAIKTIISKQLNSVEVLTVSNGQKAYDAYKEHRPDLIISDWNMPNMSGKDLLAKIRIEHDDQNTPFLMLTARADADSVRDAISSGVTEYVAKPFDKASLIEKIDYLIKSSNKDSVVAPVFHAADETVHLRISELIRIRLKKGYVNFPVLPEIAIKAVSIINSDNVSMSDVADVVKIDTALSSKIMSLANSVFYRARTAIESLEEAIARIGLRETMNAVLIYSMKELYRDKNKTYEKFLRDLWGLTLTTAAIARALGQSLHYPKPEKIYLLGMFYNIGKLMILPILMDMKKNRADITEQVVHDVMADIGSEVGAAVMKHWGFSELFISTVKSKYNKDQSDLENQEVGLVQIASYVSHEMAHKEISKSEAEVLEYYKAMYGVSDAVLAEAIIQGREYVSEVKNSLF